MENQPATLEDLDVVGSDGENLRRLIGVLDLIAAERARLHGGDEQGAVMRLLLRHLLDGDSAGMPLLRLSKLTEIPRETLRRKLGPLLNKGFLLREADGRYRLGRAYLKAGIESRKAVLAALLELRPPEGG